MAALVAASVGITALPSWRSRNCRARRIASVVTCYPDRWWAGWGSTPHASARLAGHVELWPDPLVLETYRAVTAVVHAAAAEPVSTAP
jgi:hypothetical protein